MCVTIELGQKIKIEVSRAEPGMPVFVSITDERGNQSDYWVERIPADFGIGVQFRKIWDGRSKDFDHRTYEVNLDTVSWLHECDCMAHASYGRCRHVSAAIALLDEGMLALPNEKKQEVA